MIKKVKDTVPWIYVINDLNGGEIAGTFYKNKFEKARQKELRIKRLIKKQAINYMLN